MPSRFAAVTNKEMSQLIKHAVPEIHEEGDEVRFWSFNTDLIGKPLPFLLEFIDKTFEKVFCLPMQIKLSLALLYLVDLFIHKLKTKFNNLFYRIILNTKRIHNSFWRRFPARARQMP